MDALLPFIVSLITIVGIVASIAGVESRDGFDRNGGGDAHRSHGH
jgi:hypothetical protein